ncbi:hypothetical protein, partial [Vibrio hyugaensis]|uniref:hypothetical protein n=1 Tax=Vibrio hyugaensis TaxID=1534743 RepID=UPI001E3D297C
GDLWDHHCWCRHITVQRADTNGVAFISIIASFLTRKPQSILDWGFLLRIAQPPLGCSPSRGILCFFGEV